MGSSIGERLKADYQVVVFDKDKEKTGGVAKIKVASDITSLLKDAEVVILAAKPQDFEEVLKEGDAEQRETAQTLLNQLK